MTYSVEMVVGRELYVRDKGRGDGDEELGDERVMLISILSPIICAKW